MSGLRRVCKGPARGSSGLRRTFHFVISRNMETGISDRLAALGHPQRRAVLRLLLRRYPDHVPAGEIAAALAIKPATLSAYLARLTRVGLAARARRGTSLRYAADLAGLRALTGGLWAECRTRPDLSPHPPARRTRAAHGQAEAMTESAHRVLFVCSGNSARSVFAESILRHEAGGTFVACSAGTTPASRLNPLAVKLLASKGHDIAPLRAKHVSEFQGAGAPEFDFAFTVCDRAANEECPPWRSRPLTAHWSTPDPVEAEGEEAERMLAFQRAYDMLRRRIVAFAALPFDTLDRISLQTALDDIARQGVSA